MGVKEMQEALELRREMTLKEREWARGIFEDSDLDRKLREENTSDDNLRRIGLEDIANNDPDSILLIESLKRAAANGYGGFTYAVLDVKKMTRINNKYGERVGDMILQEVRNTAHYVLNAKGKYRIEKPRSENQFTKGDQLFLILNYATEAREDLQEVADEISATAAKKVHTKLQRGFHRMPAKWEELENERVTVSICYVAVPDIKPHLKKEEEVAKCSLVPSLKMHAFGLLKKAKEKDGNVVIGIN